MLRDLAAQAGQLAPGDERLPALPAHGSLVRALQKAPWQAAGPGQGPDDIESLPLIAELKRASPSAGTLLRGDVASYLAGLRRGGACAISAVTAGGRFQGSFAVLRDAHAAGLPTLMKDFVQTPAQLDAAVRHGASAVLLIEKLVAGDERERLVRQAHDRGLEVLLEVHDAVEAEGAATSRADLLGVNSRDLDQLGIDIAAALVVLRRLKDDQPDRPALLLSGVVGAAQAEAAREAGASGILVGTALMKARDPATTARLLRRPIAKVCGNRTPEDVAVALAGGADLVGVIVAAGSRRDVDLEQAGSLLRQAEAGGAASVAVTRDQTAAGLLELVVRLRPRFLQVHGALEAGTVAALQTAGAGVLQAIAPGGQPVAGCDGTVTDSDPRGGSGIPHAGRSPIGPGVHLVAGGLEAANVAEAVQRSGAAGADASSRLETDGRKDAAKVAAFVRAAQRARRRSHGA
ncbi:MAG TPA: bifunctional indole-3-glycerol phosphate synthase/phosphoribosylanthranilate isomerase [Candidatus Thermoplasmatota archaeon]|nr:bifunctional indole-3-glycerol phosphate synthase/phosphoribosylanthranilate isomerase [Candidatus Thermoplasmatota archaeon]